MDDLITQLIEEIAPLNNKYREGIKSNLSGTEILKIMWDVGEILLKHEIKKIHSIAWKIYGKERGIRRSYITRDFLSYCYRIRKFFERKSVIDEEYPFLRRYSLFREAFPLLENPKYALDKEERNKLINLLNSQQPLQAVKKKIIRMKKEKNRIYNDRRQRLSEMAHIRDNFIEIYKDLSDLIQDNDLSAVKIFREKMGDDMLSQLSQLCLSFTQEGLSFLEIDQNQTKKFEEKWKLFCENLIKLSNSDIETRNRFRRLVPISKIIEVAEILNGLRTDDEYSNLANKLKGFRFKSYPG